MDYIAEAKKFIQLAVDAQHPDVVREQLKMADWCLGQEIEEREARRREDAGTRHASH
jgi:hypothetical protein